MHCLFISYYACRSLDPFEVCHPGFPCGAKGLTWVHCSLKSEGDEDENLYAYA